MNFEHIDSHLTEFTNLEQGIASIVDIANRIFPRCSSLVIYRLCFRWICDHIEYDTSDNNDMSWEQILRVGKAACGGYTLLYEKLCKLCGIPGDEILSVHGWCKGLDGRGVPLKIGETPNHGWNLVKIGKKWHPVDCTWGAGSVDDKGFVKFRRDEYFLINPIHLRYTHLALEGKYQLCETPIDMESWMKLPRLSVAFFTFGLEMCPYSPLPKKYGESIVTPKKNLSFYMTSPRNVQVRENLFYFHSGKWNIALNSSRVLGVIEDESSDRMNVQILCTFPEVGFYKLNIFVGPALAPLEKFHIAISLSIQNTTIKSI